VLVVAVDQRGLGVGGYCPESGTVLLLLPPHRSVLAEEGEPLVGDPFGEDGRVEEVDVGEVDVGDVQFGLTHVGHSLLVIGQGVR